MLKKMNPNVEIPMPKVIEIKKLAVMLDSYRNLRRYGQRAEDLSQPADSIHIQDSDSEMDIETTNFLLN